MTSVPTRLMSRAGCFSSSSRPLGYRLNRCEYGVHRSMAFSSIRSCYIARKLPTIGEIDSRHFKHPTRDRSVQMLCGIAVISITSAGDVEGCYDLNTTRENICIASALLTSTFAINAISSRCACVLLPFLSKSSLYLLKDRNSKAL